MSFISDFKSSPFAMFVNPSTTTNYSGTATTVSNGYTGTGLNGTPDYSLDALLGSKWQTADGRTLTLISNAGTALVAGILVQSAAEVTGHQKLAITVPAATPATIGTFQILATNGATVIKQNFYAGGLLVVDSGTGIGQQFQIASHPQAAASATCLITLIDPIGLTLDATSTVSLFRPNAKEVIISPATTATGAPVGSTYVSVPAATLPTFDGTSGAQTAAGTPQYSLVVSHGPAGILVDSTVTNVGYPIGVSKTTAGTVGVASLTTVPQIGVSMQTLTSAHTGLIYLFL